ncbi:MAG: hypothetical protein ACMXYG_00965 [Candidatus Woesearchaeota archaeon]
MKKIKRLELEFITASFIFLLMIMFTSIFMNQATLTGYAIYENPVEAQSAVQQFFRNEMFNSLKSGTKICINIKNDIDDYYSYKIRKPGNIITVEPSDFYCEGRNNEDWVFMIKSHSQLEMMNNFFDINMFTKKATNDYFEVWLSRYIENEEYVICDDHLKRTYCDFINKNLKKSEQRALGITCCLDIDTENPAGNIFIDFIEQFWLLILLFIIGIIIGTGAIVVLSTKDKEIPSKDNIKEITEYIKKVRQQGFDDLLITNQLSDAGWKKQDITEAYEKIRKEDLYSLNDRFEKTSLKK